MGFVKCSDCGVELVDHLPVNVVAEKDQPDLVVIRTYPSGLDADLAKSVLDAAGIDCAVQGDQGIRRYYLGLALPGGISLLVRPKDAEDADKLLT